MLSKASRLPSAEFLGRGYKTLTAPYFSLKVKPNVLHKNRIGVIISVAAVPSAARRNFWKRQIKSEVDGWKLGAGGYDMLVIFFKKGNSLARAALRDELRKAFSRAMQQQ